MQPTLRLAFWLSLALAVACMGVLAVLGEPLKLAVSPLGIVSFELCAYAGDCESIASVWRQQVPLHAAMNLGFDYLFMLAYPALITCGLLWAAGRLPSSLRRFSLVMVAAVWLAGGADAVENYHLFQLLMGQPAAAHAWPATLAASLKFALLLPAVLICLVGVIAGRRRPANAA